MSVYAECSCSRNPLLLFRLLSVSKKPEQSISSNTYTRESLIKSRYTSCRLIFRPTALKMLGIFTDAFADAIRITWNTAQYSCAFRLAGQKIFSAIRTSELISGSLNQMRYDTGRCYPSFFLRFLKSIRNKTSCSPGYAGEQDVKTRKT